MELRLLRYVKTIWPNCRVNNSQWPHNCVHPWITPAKLKGDSGRALCTVVCNRLDQTPSTGLITTSLRLPEREAWSARLDFHWDVRLCTRLWTCTERCEHYPLFLWTCSEMWDYPFFLWTCTEMWDYPLFLWTCTEMWDYPLFLCTCTEMWDYIIHSFFGLSLRCEIIHSSLDLYWNVKLSALSLDLHWDASIKEAFWFGRVSLLNSLSQPLEPLNPLAPCTMD